MILSKTTAVVKYYFIYFNGLFYEWAAARITSIRINLNFPCYIF